MMIPRLAQRLLAISVDVPNWEELNVLLERFPTFVNMEPLTYHMNELFSVMERIPMDVSIDL